MANISFDELIARREQREADKLRIGALKIPGTDKTLEAKMPGNSVLLSIYGAANSATDAEQALNVAKKALYSACPQLQDIKLHQQLDCTDEPIRVIDALFSLAEIDSLGGQALKFMGIIPDDHANNDSIESVKN